MRSDLPQRLDWYRRRLGTLSRRYFAARALHQLRIRGRRLLRCLLPAGMPRIRWARGRDAGREAGSREVPIQWYESREQSIASVRERFERSPHLLDALREEVGGLASGRMPLPLVGVVPFDPARDWHRDPATGADWPLVFGRSIDLARPERGRDPKVLWHAGRMHHVAHLATAHALGDSRASHLLMEHVEGFRRTNPYPLGLHWSSPLEAAIRAIQILWTLHVAGDAVAIDARESWMELLHAHGTFIEENLEDQAPLGGVNGNHLIVNLTGLLALGTALPFFEASERWVRRSAARLAQELERQVDADGMDYENSTGYHRFVLEACLLADCFARVGGRHLEGMREWLSAVVRPDGTLPLVGDFDGGRVFSPFPLEEADASEWLPQSRRPALEVFPSAGLVVARAGDAHLVCSAWGTGLKGTGAHSHADAGGFDLWACGAPLVVDPGTYVYSADLAARNWFRSTAAHNTVTVDGNELLAWDPAQLFVANGDRSPRITRTAEDPMSWEVELVPALLPLQGLRLTRDYRLDREGHGLRIHDLLTGSGTHRMEASLHFAPGALRRGGDGTWVHWTDGVELAIRIDDESEQCEEDGWVSRSYGERVPAPVLRIARQGPLPLEWEIRLEWRPL